MREFGALLMLTEACNGCCSYCFQGSEHRNKHMSLETAVDIIEKCKESKYYNKVIDLFGGEPTLNMGLVKELMDRYDPAEYSYRITTNGNFINLSKEMREYFDKIDLIEISIETNDNDSWNYRKIKNIKKFINDTYNYYKTRNNYIKFNITLTTGIKEHIDEAIDVINLILDIMHVSYRVALHIGMLRKPSENPMTKEYESIEDLESVLEYIKSKNLKVYKKLIGYTPDFMYSSRTVLEEDSPSCGYEGLIAFNTQGILHPCTHYLGTSENFYKFQHFHQLNDLGEYFNNLTNNMVNSVNKWKNEFLGCSGCELNYTEFCSVCKNTIDEAMRTGEIDNLIFVCKKSRLFHKHRMEMLEQKEDAMIYSFENEY